MAQNFTDSPSNGATQSFNGVVYTYNSSKAIWTAKTSDGISLTDLSVGAEPTASGNGDVSYNNTTGVITYTPPVIGSGGTTTVYNTASLLPLSGNSDGDMAFAKDNNRFYVWNGAGWYSVALVNASPTISSGVSSSVSLATNGTATVVTITASDPEGNPLTYGYSVTSGSLTNGGGATATIAQGTGASTNVFTVTPTTTEDYAGNFSLTFTASDGVSTAVSVGAFTLTFSVPQHFSTALKVKTSGANGRTNSVFDDSSTGNHTVTASGGAYQTTFSPHTNSSIVMDGNGDYLQFANATQHDRSGVVNWTLEAWVWLDAYSTQSDASGLWYSKYNYPSPAAGLFIGVDVSQGNRTFVRVNSGNTQTLVGNYTFPLREWVHVALVRNGNGTNNISLYENGTLQMQISQANTVSNVTVPVDIGRRSSFYPNNTWNGKIHTVRMNNTAVYTTDFTPPTANLTATSDTAFLIGANSGNFNDQSTNAQIPTVNGQCKIDGTSPFIPNSWQTNKGGSAYIAGTGDKLNIPAHADFVVGTGDFSIECWVYIVSQSQAYASIFDFRGSTTRNDATAITLVYSASKMYIYSSPTFHVNNIPRKLHTWQHLVFQRRTIGGTPTAEFYIDGVLFHTAANSTNWSANNGIDIGTSRDPNWVDHGNFYIADFKFNKGSAAYSGAFTPPTAPTAIQSDTKLKLNFDQVGVFDSVSKVNLSLVGTGVQESQTQTKYATTNLRLAAGNSRYAYLENLDPPRTGDFQVETWLYLDANQTVSQSEGAGIFRLFPTTGGAANSQNGVSMALYIGRLYINYDYSNGFANTGDNLSKGTWHHLVYLRKRGKIYIFLNGTEIYSATNTVDFTGTTGYLGAFYNYTAHCIDGYLEDFRYLNGHTTYPNENPSEKHTAITNTKIQFANTTSIPSTVNSLAVTTTAGTPVRTSLSPLRNDVGTSFYYASACNKIAYSADALNWGTGDFTVQWWQMIPTASGGAKAILDTRVGGTGSQAGWTLAQNGANLYLYSGGSSVNHYIWSIPFTYTKWSYYVFQRAGGTSSVFVDGFLHQTSTLARTYTQTEGFYVGGYSTSELHPNVYIADLRIVKGTALYGTTNNFSPPSAAL